jgi:hypothetical protein
MSSLSLDSAILTELSEAISRPTEVFTHLVGCHTAYGLRVNVTYTCRKTLSNFKDHLCLFPRISAYECVVASAFYLSTNS